VKRESGANPELPRSGKQVRTPTMTLDQPIWEVLVSRVEPAKSEDLPWKHTLAPPRGGEVAVHPFRVLESQAAGVFCFFA
jgi:hypothetical protein